MKKDTQICIGYVLLVFCSLGFWINASRFKGTLASANSFKRVQGKITMSRIGAHQRRNRKWFFGRETVYYHDLRYQYQVGNQTYTSKEVNFQLSQSYTDSTSVQKDFVKYPVGKMVPVFYLFDNPSFCFG